MFESLNITDIILLFLVCSYLIIYVGYKMFFIRRLKGLYLYIRLETLKFYFIRSLIVIVAFGLVYIYFRFS